MEAKKRLIDVDVLIAGYKACVENDPHEYIPPAMIVEDLESQPLVDAVPVDEIKFLYMAIDKNGIPELKVQLGDRIFCLRRENDPVDVVPVVRCKDCKYYDNSEGICWCKLNSKFYPGGFDWHSFPEDGFCSYGEKK